MSSREQYRSLLERQGVLVWLLDQDWGVEGINKQSRGKSRQSWAELVLRRGPKTWRASRPVQPADRQRKAGAGGVEINCLGHRLPAVCDGMLCWRHSHSIFLSSDFMVELNGLDFCLLSVWRMVGCQDFYSRPN